MNDTSTKCLTPPQISAPAPETQTGTKIDQLPPQPAQTGPSAAQVKSAPSKKKSPAAKKSGRGIGGKLPQLPRNRFAALKACQDRGVNPFDTIIDIMTNKAETASVRYQAAQMLISRIEPELRAVNVEVPTPQTPAPAQPAPVTEAKVMKLVDKI